MGLTIQCLSSKALIHISICSSVVKCETANRIVPFGYVPSVWCASGAQCSPMRVMIPHLSSNSTAAVPLSIWSIIMERTCPSPERICIPGTFLRFSPSLLISCFPCFAMFSSPWSLIQLSPAFNPASPQMFCVPLSNRSGRNSGCAKLSDRLPVPPIVNGWIFSVFTLLPNTIPPVPV